MRDDVHPHPAIRAAEAKLEEFRRQNPPSPWRAIRRRLEEVAAAVVTIVFIMWVASLFGWEPPTPENIRKLDRQIEEQRKR